MPPTTLLGSLLSPLTSLGRVFCTSSSSRMSANPALSSVLDDPTDGADETALNGGTNGEPTGQLYGECLPALER